MQRNILIISVTTLITIIIWTVVELLGSSSEVPLADDIQKNISQKNYSFSTDKKFLEDNLKKKDSIIYTRDQLNGIK